jgi:hypothetical protein
MDKTIKTREVVKDIKTLDKKALVSSTIKNVHAKTKDAAEQQDNSADSSQQHGNAYAEDKTEQAAIQGAASVSHKIAEKGKQAYSNIRQSHSLSKQATQQSAKAAQQTAGATSSQAATSKQAAATSRAASGAAAKQSAKNTAKQTAKGSIKTTAKSVKTASATTGKAIKTTQQAAQSSKTAAKTTQIAAKNAAAATRTAAKASAAATKAAAKGIAAFAKAAIAAAKSLVTAIAAGGWIAVAVVLIICMVALVAVSAFGIFFTGGTTQDGNPSMREVIATINQEEVERVNQIKADNPHDDVIVSGSHAPWKEVLAVYAVKTTTNTDQPSDAITLDERRQEILRNIYADMNTIEYRTEQRESYRVTLVEGEDGALIEETEAITVTTLYITYNSLSAGEAATLYNFNAAQLDLLYQLLNTEYDSMWQAVLYGVHNGSGNIVEVATSQIGNVGGQPYWSWYGFGSRVEWCACFVSWCANECGYIEAGIIPKFAGCEWQGEAWFKDRGQWQERGYVPQPGDIIFFDWNGDDISDHVGIVESSDGTTIRTIEGNNGDACRRSSYSVNSSSVAGFGIPANN